MTAENLTDLPQKNDELTDEQLDKVAGGFPITQGFAQGVQGAVGSATSNLLKKIPDISSGIISNMK